MFLKIVLGISLNINFDFPVKLDRELNNKRQTVWYQTF